MLVIKLPEIQVINILGSNKWKTFRPVIHQLNNPTKLTILQQYYHKTGIWLSQ